MVAFGWLVGLVELFIEGALVATLICGFTRDCFLCIDGFNTVVGMSAYFGETRVKNASN